MLRLSNYNKTKKNNQFLPRNFFLTGGTYPTCEIYGIKKEQLLYEKFHSWDTKIKNVRGNFLKNKDAKKLLILFRKEQKIITNR